MIQRSEPASSPEGDGRHIQYNAYQHIENSAQIQKRSYYREKNYREEAERVKDTIKKN
jgi:hypothetical protein